MVFNKYCTQNILWIVMNNEIFREKESVLMLLSKSTIYIILKSVLDVMNDFIFCVKETVPLSREVAQ